MSKVSDARQKIDDGTYDSDTITTETVNRLLVAECNYFNPKIEPMSPEQALLIASAYPERFIDYEGDWDRRNVGDRWACQD